MHEQTGSADEPIGPFGNKYENPELPPPWFEELVTNSFDADALLVVDGEMAFVHDPTCECGQHDEIRSEHRFIIVFEREAHGELDPRGEEYPEGLHREAASFDDNHARGLAFSLLRRMDISEIIAIARDAAVAAIDPSNVSVISDLMRDRGGVSMQVTRPMPPSAEGIEFLQRGAGDAMPDDAPSNDAMPDGDGEGRS